MYQRFEGMCIFLLRTADKKPSIEKNIPEIKEGRNWGVAMCEPVGTVLSWSVLQRRQMSVA
jgi:hypothetical protein